MKLASYSRASLLAISTLAAIWAAGCSDDDPEGTAGAGGDSVASGGKSTTGTGGKTTTNGGTVGTAGNTTTSSGGTAPGVGGTNAAGDTGTPGVGGVGGAGVGGAGVGGVGVGGAGVAGAGVGGTVTAGAGGTITATGGTSSGAGTAGNAPGSGGASGAGCGTTPSTVSQTWAFTGPALPTGWKADSGATVTFVTSPAICAAGCAAFAFTMAAGSAWSGAVTLNYQFSALTNLYGATITANVALDVPAANVAGTSLQIFDQGGGNDGTAWGTVADMPQAQRGVTTQLFPVELKPSANASTGHCAATVIKLGLMVQRSATAAAAYSGVLYISDVKITSPGGNTGTGGAAGAAGAAGATSTGAAGDTGTAGAGGTGGTAGAAGSTDVAGNAGTAGAN